MYPYFVTGIRVFYILPKLKMKKNFDVWVSKILRLEGGFVNNPNDLGGCTNKGITLETFKDFYGRGNTVDDLKCITDEQAAEIYRKNYWDKVKAERIDFSPLSYLLADFAVNSGVRTAVKGIQKIVGVEVDGIIGNMTLNAINEYDGTELFNRLKEYRVEHYQKIVENNPSQKIFLRGWLNRLDEYKI